ncbi:uncharacterized protein ACN427_007851 [Glossina fuscipes fuscipes]
MCKCLAGSIVCCCCRCAVCLLVSLLSSAFVLLVIVGVVIYFVYFYDGDHSKDIENTLMKAKEKFEETKNILQH